MRRSETIFVRYFFVFFFSPFFALFSSASYSVFLSVPCVCFIFFFFLGFLLLNRSAVIFDVYACVLVFVFFYSCERVRSSFLLRSRAGVCSRARKFVSWSAYMYIYRYICVCVCVCIVLSLCRKRTMELKMFGVCKGSVRSMRICSETEIVVFIVNG